MGLVFVVAAALAACGPGAGSDAGSDTGSDAPRVTPPECTEISAACHSYDDGDAGTVPHMCHELGHDRNATAAQCSAQRATCLAACPPRDGGHSHGDASSEGGH